MTSHILLPQIDAHNPATLSSAVLQGLLRGELGFGGVIVSDALDMAGASGAIGIPAAAARALAAGCDLLCIGTRNTAEQLESIVAAVEAAASAGELPVARLEDAAARVAALAAAVAPSTPVPNSMDSGADSGSGWSLGPADGPGSIQSGVDAERVAASFSVTPDARAALRASAGPWVLLRLELAANVAVGEVPWGPFAALAERHPSTPVLAVDGADLSVLERIPEGACVVLVGRDNERHAGARAAIDAVAASGRTVLVVDMGWPGGSSRYAGVATYGASALVGEALVGFLEREGVLS